MFADFFSLGSSFENETMFGIVSNLEMEYIKKARGTITGICEFVAPTELGEHKNIVVEGHLKDSADEVVAKIRATWKLEIF